MKESIAILIVIVVAVAGIVYAVVSQRNDTNLSTVQPSQDKANLNVPQPVHQPGKDQVGQDGSQTIQPPVQSTKDAGLSTSSDDSQNIVLFSGSVERALGDDSGGGLYEFEVRYYGGFTPVGNVGGIVKVKTGSTMRLVPGAAYVVRAYYIPEEKIYYIYEIHRPMQLDI